MVSSFLLKLKKNEMSVYDNFSLHLDFMHQEVSKNRDFV